MSQDSFSLKDLLALDDHLKIVLGDINSLTEILCPKDLSNIEQGHFLFVKDKKFLNKILENVDELNNKKFGLIIDQGLFEKSSEQASTFIKNSLSWCITTDCMNISISRVSKYFYDIRELSLFPLVDGRQMSSTVIDPSANISQNVSIGANIIIEKNVTIHSGAVIMANSHILEDSVIYPNVTIYPFVKIGKNNRIHSSSVIGADGFGYNFQDGLHHKIWHFGSVITGDNVEIGANSCVDGGTFSPTLIGDGCKIDNHVQIGHNCKLGVGVIVCGHVAIGGSSTLGDFTVFGGKSGMGNGHSLGRGCQVAGGALVNSDWPDGSTLGGHPARNLKEWMRGLAYVRKESLFNK